ncbi:MAG: type II secretion system F family protein [Oscillospiraceae bacterium]|nr:type II secretion system F family protein [Oscillospiraceae bacterium]
MTIIILIPATLLLAVWLLLLGRATDEDRALATHSHHLDKLATIKKLKEKEKQTKEKLESYNEKVSLLLRNLIFRDKAKEIQKLEKAVLAFRQGKAKNASVFILPGYVLLREVEALGKGAIHKNILSKSFELFGKKHAQSKTKQLLAKLIAYPIIGIASTLTLGVIILGSISQTVGIAVMGIGTVLMIVLVYAMYDELDDMVKKRQKSISREFPNVVSKLALLVTSGMIMDRAWKETSSSGDTELYLEMRKTSQELDNLVSPETAYSNFINRCNTKESAKLASAIMQNLSKGNAQIGKLLKDMAREAWQERRHTAKRDAEKANSKLMIPTMLLFLAILVMLMVPVAMNFSGL